MAEHRMTKVACSRGSVLGLLFSFLTSAGCGAASGGGTGGSAPPRSPSEDYAPPGAQTSNGEVAGSDQVPPGDKLQTGPRVGTAGIVPAAQPPHGEPKQKR
jgi:hypothetical protein